MYKLIYISLLVVASFVIILAAMQLVSEPVKAGPPPCSKEYCCCTDLGCFPDCCNNQCRYGGYIIKCSQYCPSW